MGSKQEAKSDLGYVYRIEPNGETKVIPIALDNKDFLFQDKDELRILSEKHKLILMMHLLNISGEVKITT